MDNQTVEITRKQLDQGIITDKCNQIIVEIPYTNLDRKSKGGVIVGHHKDLLFAEGKDAHNADCQEVWGVVSRLPEKLYFNRKDSNSMDWETDIEVKVGDTVFFGIMASANATELLCEGKIYKLINYQELIVARREEVFPDNTFIKKITEIIPLNGYVLCSEVHLPKLSELDVTSEDKIDNDKAIVRYVGKPNKQYKNTSHVDHLDLESGDLVLLDRYPHVKLERTTWFSDFSDDTLIVVPRRKISMVIKRNEENSNK